MKSLLGVTLVIAAFGMLEPCTAAVPDRGPTDPPPTAARGGTPSAAVLTSTAPRPAGALGSGELAALSLASAEVSRAERTAAQGTTDDAWSGDSFDWEVLAILLMLGGVYLLLAG